MSDKKDRQSASTKANADKTAEKENFFDISHNGKDITFKDLTSRHISKPFEVLGLEDIKIKKSIEKELPAVTANIHMGDDIFLLEDNTFLIVDYESSFLKKKTLKYINYSTQLINKYDPDGKGINIKVLVIYSCDVASAKPSYKGGAFRLDVATYYMSAFPGQDKFNEINQKISNQIMLTDTDLMALIFAPLSNKGNEAKNQMISEVLKSVDEIKKTQPDNREFVITHIATMYNNILTEENRDRIKEALRMTWIDEYYRNEMKEALRQKDKETEEALRQKDKETEEALKQKDILIRKNLVQHVDNVMKANQTSLDKACTILGTSPADYYEAHAVLARAANQ